MSRVPVDLNDLPHQGQAGTRKARQYVPSPSGRYRRAAPAGTAGAPLDLALDATLKRAALRRSALVGLSPSSAPVAAGASAFAGLDPADYCVKLRYRPCDRLIVLLVDASDSMGQGAVARMRAAKGTVFSILHHAYQDRSQVALVAFSGEEASVVLPPTHSVALARRSLERLPTGGATPFADGLLKAWHLIRQARLKNPALRPVLTLVSDGEANVPLRSGTPPLRELLALAAGVRQDRIPAVVIDVLGEPRPAVELKLLATQLGASYVRTHELQAHHILEALAALPVAPG